jgi:hypothetical protein
LYLFDKQKDLYFKEGKLDTARELFRMGLSLEQIQQATQLGTQTLQKLEKETR